MKSSVSVCAWADQCKHVLIRVSRSISLGVSNGSARALLIMPKVEKFWTAQLLKQTKPHGISSMLLCQLVSRATTVRDFRCHGVETTLKSHVWKKGLNDKSCIAAIALVWLSDNSQGCAVSMLHVSYRAIFMKSNSCKYYLQVQELRTTIYDVLCTFILLWCFACSWQLDKSCYRSLDVDSC